MNPFKEIEEFEKEINLFLKKHKSFLADQGRRISDYFEMSCYNMLVGYYQFYGFSVTIENLIGKKFKYKLSPSGYPENFSFFTLKKSGTGSKSNVDYAFEIHHNLTVQSGHQEDIYLTPDIVVINKGSIISDYDHYLVERSTKKFCYVKNEDVHTFCEVKNFTPFPELLYSFIGLYNELKQNAINSGLHLRPPSHIAPSLLISGKENEHTRRIKNSLEDRYALNIVFDLFEVGDFFSLHAPKQILSMATLTETKPEAREAPIAYTEPDVDLPF